MDFSFAGHHESDTFASFAGGLKAVMERHGHSFVTDPQDALLVVNFFPEDKPKAFRRRAQAVFLVSVSFIEGPWDHPIAQCYPLLIRSMANLLVGLTGGTGNGAGPDAHFVTPEQGHYVVDGEDDETAYFEHIYTRIEPLASSRMVIDNVFTPDLPEELWKGDEITESISRAGRRLGALNLLPTPFPLDRHLSERDRKHLLKLYGLGGLSYGNVSARKDDKHFWMSASGVDKTHLHEIGREVLLVTDYDSENNAMLLSVPPAVEPRRVSVDAIEHWMIYREHPEVGAILHVHAWIEGVPSTEFNFPCGTYELGKAVADIIRQAPDPSRCVVGLKNHGLTITGHSLDQIFADIDGKIINDVPMS